MRWVLGVNGGTTPSVFQTEAWQGRVARWLCAWLLTALLGNATVSGADQLVAPEYSLKAAYICNFPEFSVWPEATFATTNSPIILGILGDDPFGPALDKVAGTRSVNGRSFQIRRLKNLASIRECHLLFVSLSESKKLPEIFAALNNAPVLTVSDGERFAERGGMINLRLDGKKVRFEINLGAAEHANLKFKAQLLKLGTIVETGPAAVR